MEVKLGGPVETTHMIKLATVSSSYN